jgi:hypothetical protein
MLTMRGYIFLLPDSNTEAQMNLPPPCPLSVVVLYPRRRLSHPLHLSLFPPDAEPRLQSIRCLFRSRMRRGSSSAGWPCLPLVRNCLSVSDGRLWAGGLPARSSLLLVLGSVVCRLRAHRFARARGRCRSFPLKDADGCGQGEEICLIRCHLRHPSQELCGIRRDGNLDVVW